MRSSILFVSILFLFSCNSKKQEVLDMDDIISSSEKYKEGDVKEETEPKVYYFDSLGTFSQLVSDTLGIKRTTILIPDSVLFPDRFISRSKEKWNGKSETGEQLISIWTYNDSLELKNALFNWLDCFGKKCNSLQLYEEKKISSESFLIYATEKKIIYMSSSLSIDVKTQLENLNRLLSKEKILYVISQGIGRKTEWWEFVDKKWLIKKIEK
tara:strand:+ start:1136 stop:1771 length:636 start_codon:yes stop_codon:yes gene_type:complete